MFRVVWLQAALDDLARLWVMADSALRQAITAAVPRLEHRLRTNPEEESESRQDLNQRVIVEGPLVAFLEMDDDNGVIVIGHVRLSQKRKA